MVAVLKRRKAIDKAIEIAKTKSNGSKPAAKKKTAAKAKSAKKEDTLLILLKMLQRRRPRIQRNPRLSRRKIPRRQARSATKKIWVAKSASAERVSECLTPALLHRQVEQRD